MSNSANLGLPMVQANQAQKHVTVNEALSRLDALTHLTLTTLGQPAPPAGAAEGEVHAVPTGATGAWAGRDGQLAIFLNGGWAFVSPAPGWAGHAAETGARVVFDGSGWVGEAAAVSPSGAGLRFAVAEIDHAVTPGASSTTPPVIPAGAIVFGVTGRVLSELAPGGTTFRLGLAGVSDDRYGSGIGTAAGAWLRGITGQPQAYFADTALTLTAEAGLFTGGTVRLAVHHATLGLPGA